MKSIKKIFLSAFVITSLISCVSETLDKDDNTKGNGQMCLNVNIQKPINTRAITETSNYEVSVMKDEAEIKYYDRADKIPEKVTLPVDNYNVVAHTPGEIKIGKMDAPYYKGEASMEILKGITTNVNVICKMYNSCVKINYSEDFNSIFREWAITLTDGEDNNIDLDENTDSVYWFFGEEGVKELKMNFQGTTKSGKKIEVNKTLEKEDNEVEKYDDDKTNFSGGDIINLTFEPTEAGYGTVSIDVLANVTFDDNEKEETINIIVKDKDNEPIIPGSEAITLTLPAPITFSAEESANDDPAFLKQGDVKIACENGIKSLMVYVDSKSEEMMEQLATVADEYEGVDLVNGAQVVGNQNLVEFLAGLGQDITVPSVNDKEYTFPIGNFFLFLGILPGEHNFILEVEDMNGNKKQGTVTVTITDGEEEPCGDKITLTLPALITFSAEESANDDPAFLKKGDVKIACENGIKSLIVYVNSKNDEMMEQLTAVADEYEGVNLVEGAEVVGNQNLVEFLAGLGQDITVPSVNDKEYTFPIGNFFLFLGILPGEHNFILEVEDMSGNKKQGTVTINITE